MYGPATAAALKVVPICWTGLQQV